VSDNASPDGSAGDSRWDQVFGASGAYKDPKKGVRGARWWWARVILGVSYALLALGFYRFITKGEIIVAFVVGALLLVVGMWLRGPSATVRPPLPPPPGEPRHER
jgi:hypothetical protein